MFVDAASAPGYLMGGLVVVVIDCARTGVPHSVHTSLIPMGYLQFGHNPRRKRRRRLPMVT